MASGKKCPRCGSKDIEISSANSINRSDPPYRCCHCRHTFGSLPLVLDEKGNEYDLRDAVTYICFRKMSYIGSNSKEIELRKSEDGLFVDVLPSMSLAKEGEYIQHEVHRKLDESEWEYVLNRLYEKMFLHDWKHDYNDRENIYAEPEFIVMDGSYWELSVGLRDDTEQVYSGSQTYLPPYWRELEYTFKKFFMETQS